MRLETFVAGVVRWYHEGKVPLSPKGENAVYAVLYVEINLLCVVMLCYIVAKVNEAGLMSSHTLAYRRVAIVLIVTLAIDAIWGLVDGRPDIVSRAVATIVAVAYFTGSAAVAFSWVLFDETKMRGLNDVPRKVRVTLFMPVVAMLVLGTASVWTGWLFSIASDGTYARGPLFFLQPLLCYGLLALSAARMTLHCLHARSREHLREMRSTLLLCLVPIAGGLAAVLLPGVPVVWPTATFALAVHYMRNQSNQVYADALTGLNNRRRFDAFVASLVSEHPYKSGLWIGMCDLDRFKSINDRFGHVEGDRALVRVGGALKAACREFDGSFVARYGGDEFVAVVPGDAEDVRTFGRTVLARCAEGAEADACGYDLELSIGWAPLDASSEEAVDRSLEAADAALYEEKAARSCTIVPLPKVS